ncbi:MAG: hypothetical protein ABR574_11770 [Cryomorphaceae bacterium]
MKNYLLVFVLFFAVVEAQGQVVKVDDISFPNTPGLLNHGSTDFRYFVDGSHHICTYEGLVTSYCVVYNSQTGTSQNSSFIPKRVYDFGAEKRYLGTRITGSGSIEFNRYARLAEDGQFTMVPNLPAPPKAFRNGKGYTLSDNELFEITLNPFAVTTLHTLETSIDGLSAELYISGDTIYIAHKQGFSTFSLSDSVWSAPFEAYFDAFDLTLIPKTGIRGRHLYSESGTPNTLHEIGAQSTARVIPVIEDIPDFAYINAFESYLNYQEEQGRNVANAENHTWINLLTRIDDSWDRQDHLVEINRSQNDPGLSILRSYKRSKFEDGYRRAALSALNDGENLVALGLFGDAGYEPYGFLGDSISVLKDLIPGSAGSVDYLVEATTSNINNPNLFEEAYDQFFFVGSSPGFGREICVSNGTPEGTRVVADLQPGLKGLRRVRFTTADGLLYAFVQMHDYRTAIYQIGPQLPPTPEPEENNVIWEAFTAPLAEVSLQFIELESGNGHQTMISDDGYVYQLLDGVRPGLLTTDSLPAEDYNFSSSISHPRTLRLNKIDPATGEYVWRKPFLTYIGGSSGRAVKMLVSQDEKLRILFTGLQEYSDFDQNEIIPPIGYPVGHNTANLTTFSKDGALESIVRIQYDEWLSDVLHFSDADDGNFIGVFNASSNSIRLLKFDADGELLAIRNTDLNGFDKIRCWKGDENLLWISSHPKSDGCENCQVQLLAFNTDLEPVNLHSFRYNGSMAHPNVHTLPNGERWFTGAFDGMVEFDFANGKRTFYADNSGKLRPFVIRELVDFNFFQDAVLIDSEAWGYNPSFMREGNVFLSYFEDGRLDIPPSDENIYGTYSIPQVHQLNHVVLQLDGAGFPTDDFKQTVYAYRGDIDNLALSEGLLQNGLWWQSAIDIHMEWKSPEPEYLRSYHTGAQIAAMPWPFSPAICRSKNYFHQKNAVFECSSYSHRQVYTVGNGICIFNDCKRFSPNQQIG